MFLKLKFYSPFSACFCKTPQNTSGKHTWFAQTFWSSWAQEASLDQTQNKLCAFYKHFKVFY